MRKPPVPPISLTAQLLRLNSLGCDNAVGAVIELGGKMRFDFSLQPSEISRVYHCRIELPRAGNEPCAYVLSPDLLELANGQRAPHIYDQSGGRTKLCLFTPKNIEWHKSMWLSETLVPWTAEWLRYYEMWLADGIWQGGGEHPEVAPRKRFGIRGRR